MPGALESLLDRVGQRTATSFRVRLANGAEYRNANEPPAFTLVFHTPKAQKRTVTWGHVGLLEAYFAGEIDIQGNLAAALAVGLEGGMDWPNALIRLRNRWHEFVHSNAS